MHRADEELVRQALRAADPLRGKPVPALTVPPAEIRSRAAGRHVQQEPSIATRWWAAGTWNGKPISVFLADRDIGAVDGGVVRDRRGCVDSSKQRRDVAVSAVPQDDLDEGIGVMARGQGWIVVGLLAVIAVAVVLSAASDVMSLWQWMSMWPRQR